MEPMDRVHEAQVSSQHQRTAREVTTTNRSTRESLTGKIVLARQGDRAHDQYPIPKALNPTNTN